MKIRPARAADATPISRMIHRNLWEVNGPDYPTHVIQRLVEGINPKVVASRIANWKVVIAEDERGFAGAAGLQDNYLRMMFVLPERQRRGAGQALLDAIIGEAAKRGLTEIEVNSSVTAQNYYAKRGFVKLEEIIDRDEKTIRMVRTITGGE